MNTDNEIGVFSKVRVLDTAAFTIMAPDAGAAPTRDLYSDEQSGTYIYWGDANDWPQKARLKLEKSTSGLPLIKKLAEIIFGRGFTYWVETYDQDGNIVRDFSRIKEVDEFILNNDVEMMMMERFMDLKISGNIFCEYILSKSREKITNIAHLEAEFCRFGVVKEKEQLNKIYYSGSWPQPREKDLPKIDFVPRRNLNKNHIKSKSFNKFVGQSHLPSPGRTIYAFPPHGALFREKGWLDYGNSIPEIMNYINENAWNIKYHVQIPYDYWERINKDWDKLDEKKKTAFIDAQLKTMQEWLSGTKNAGKTFVTHFAVDMNGKEIPGFKISHFEDKSKKDDYLTSVQESDQQVARAYGIDSSLSNIQPQGGKMGAGSGSDKRTGFENQVNTGFLDLAVVIEPLKVVAMYNGWNPGIKFGFIHDIPTSLNENKNGVKTEM